MEIAGLQDDMPAHPGDAPYSALVYAINFFDHHVRRIDPTIRLFWPDGTPYAGEPLDRDPDTSDAA